MILEGYHPPPNS